MRSCRGRGASSGRNIGIKRPLEGSPEHVLDFPNPVLEQASPPAHQALKLRWLGRMHEILLGSTYLTPPRQCLHVPSDSGRLRDAEIHFGKPILNLLPRGVLSFQRRGLVNDSQPLRNVRLEHLVHPRSNCKSAPLQPSTFSTRETLRPGWRARAVSSRRTPGGPAQAGLPSA